MSERTDEQRASFRRRLDEASREGEVAYAGICLEKGDVEGYIRTSKSIAEWAPFDDDE